MELLRTLLRPVGLALSYVSVHSAPRALMEGILVSCSNVSVDCNVFHAKCDSALRLIRVYDPRRFERLKRDVRVIALSGRGASYYESRLGTVFLDVDVLKREPEYIAVTLVHEATHARLHRAGLRDYSRLPGRHERVCITQEIEFASRLPNAHHLIAELSESLDHPWWNDAGREAQVRRFVERYNLPNWLERFLVRFGAR